MFWRTNTAVGERVILVEAMSQDLRVTLRNLTVANALRRIEPARLVVFSGADEGWNNIWTYFEIEEVRALAEAYGADVVYDIHALVDRRVAGDAEPTLVDGVDLGGDLPESGIPAETFDQIVYATACRMAKIARLGDSAEHREILARAEVRSREFARVYDAHLRADDVVALITSHVDYNNFGLAVEAALRHDVPVIFPQSTGGLKAYAMYPEKQDPRLPIRANLTEEIGLFFEEHLWPNREVIGAGRDLVLYRLKASLGRPAWWRAEGIHSQIQLRNSDQRTAVRTPAAARVGLDPALPIVSVFNHAVSDALGTNVECFADLGAWFEETAAFAADHDQVGWLFVDHPQQDLYDDHGFFEAVAAQYADRPHMAFHSSLDLSKTYLTALTDLVLTVRGSVSNEYPAFGIPALQAGWSEWSTCGFTTVAESVPDYFALLDTHLKGLLVGDVLITPEQVERARLWAWFYRSASDVSSVFVGHWDLGEGDQLFSNLEVSMRQVESDGDPAFSAVRRMWRRREPFLTRMDWRRDAAALADDLAEVTG
ncbi:MAG: hypothetical protein JWR52_2695 [Marmoricola sp.]|nr:hypothetical protein [Marmoricola sp.]